VRIGTTGQRSTLRGDAMRRLYEASRPAEELVIGTGVPSADLASEGV
jgi:hypothetical protein